MNMHKPDPVGRFTKYKIGPDDLVTIYGTDFQYCKTLEDGVLLRPVSTSRKYKPKPFKYERIYELLLEGKLTIDRDHYSERNALMRAREIKSHELGPDTTMRAKMVSEFILQEDDPENSLERYHRSVEDIERFYADFRRDNPELVEEADLFIKRKGKGKLFVSPRQFQRLLTRFEISELDPRAMASRHRGGRAFGTTFTRECIAFQLIYADKYRTEENATIIDCFSEMVKDNDKLKVPHRLPKFTTFWRLVKEGNDYINDVGRSENLHRLERKYNFKKKGLVVTRPLEIIEMDDQEVDLKVFVTKFRMWDYLDPEVQTRIEKIDRVNICIAMDAFSRSICGMKVLKGAPDANSAVATLAMVAQRKDGIAKAVGAISEWTQCGRPEAVHTDAGSGYVSAKFEMACMMFTGRHRIPPSKHPHLRARVERFFRTVNQRYIHMFSGQTFSNPLAQDKYESDKYVHLTDEEFADILVRLIIDCYHNTRHGGIGMTPLQAWEYGSQMGSGGIEPPPSEDQYREVFGATTIKQIGSDGINILNITYSNRELLAVRKKWYKRKLLVRVNDQDLSSISVKHPRLNKWITVDAVFDGLKGVTLDEWHYVSLRLKANCDPAVIQAKEVVSKTIADVKEVIARSKQRPGVVVHEDLTKKLAKIEREIEGTFRFSQQQPFEYDRYDDGMNYDDEKLDLGAFEEEEEDLPTRRKAPPESSIASLSTTDPFNPSRGSTAVYDDSQFMTEEQRRKSRPDDDDPETPTVYETEMLTPAKRKRASIAARRAVDAAPPAAASDGPAPVHDTQPEQANRKPFSVEDMSNED